MRAGTINREARAINSLLDVVEEIASLVGEEQWVEVVNDTFDKHRRELRGEEVEWERER